MSELKACENMGQFRVEARRRLAEKYDMLPSQALHAVDELIQMFPRPTPLMAPSSEWEKEFDRVLHDEEAQINSFDKETIKNFIKSLFETWRVERDTMWEERIEKMKPSPTEAKEDDNWPKNSLEEFIWERCEGDNQRVREIMQRISAEKGI